MSVPVITGQTKCKSANAKAENITPFSPDQNPLLDKAVKTAYFPLHAKCTWLKATALVGKCI
jgi:hypothetical protein